MPRTFISRLTSTVLLLIPALIYSTAHGAEPDTTQERAEVIVAEVPEAMEVGQSYSVTVKVKNTGVNTWSRQNGYGLGAKNRHWGVQRIDLETAEKIAPGETATFKFRVTAPSQPGTYDYQWQLQREDRFFGPPTPAQRVIVESGSNRVKFISQVVPSAMDVGGEYTVMVQFKNLGKTNWSGASGYQLVAQNPTRNRTWGVDHVKLDSDRSVPPGEVATIRFKMNAPLQAGEYDFQWQLYNEKLGFFGERTPNQRVAVGGSGRGNDAEFVTQDIPGLVTEPTPFAVVQRGANFHVTVMLKNAGTTTWKAGVHRLISQRPRSNLTWFIDRVELSPKEEIRPGEFKSFSFTALAPSQPGIYDFEWQMSQDGIGVFGKPSQTVKITVR